MTSSLRLSAVALSGVLCLAGCGKQHDYQLAPVMGVVTLDGEPLGGGRLLFAPVANSGSVKSGRPGFADIQPDGSYVVSTYGNEDGAVVADHWVSVLNTEPDSPAGQRLRVGRVKYPNRQTVAADQENMISIELTTEILRQFGSGD